MKNRINRTIEKLQKWCEEEIADDEATDEIGNAIIHLSAAYDRLVALDEAEDDEDEEPPDTSVNDRYCAHCGETKIAIDDSVCHHCLKPLYSC